MIVLTYRILLNIELSLSKFWGPKVSFFSALHSKVEAL